MKHHFSWVLYEFVSGITLNINIKMKIGYSESVLLSSRLLDFRVQGGTKHVIGVLLTSDCLDSTGMPLFSSPMWTCGASPLVFVYRGHTRRPS